VLRSEEVGLEANRKQA